MNDAASRPAYARHRFPPAISAHAVWRSCRFALSYRAVEAPLAERGVVLTAETVRQRRRTCGQGAAAALRQRPPPPGAHGQRDEVCIRIDGVRHSLWRAVDRQGNVLALLVPARRDEAAAASSRRNLRKKPAYAPRVPITDKRASDGAAGRVTSPRVGHRRHTGPNHRAEHAHQPPRARGGCAGPKRRGTPGASWPPTAPSPAVSAPVATA